MTSCGRRSPICRRTPPLRIPFPSQDILLEGLVTLKTRQGVSLLGTASGQGHTQAGGSMPPYSHTSGGTHLRYVSYCELPRGIKSQLPRVEVYSLLLSVLASCLLGLTSLHLLLRRSTQTNSYTPVLGFATRGTQLKT